MHPSRKRIAIPVAVLVGALMLLMAPHAFTEGQQIGEIRKDAKGNVNVKYSNNAVASMVKMGDKLQTFVNGTRVTLIVERPYQTYATCSLAAADMPYVYSLTNGLPVYLYAEAAQPAATGEWSTKDGIQRKKMYTLQENETVNYSEYELFLDSGKEAYSFEITRTETNFLVINGVEYGREFNYSSQPTFSKNGSAWGFTASAGDTTHVVINGKDVGTFTYAYSLIFTADGSRWGFIAQEGEKYFIIMSDGQKFGPYKSAYSFYMSPSGAVWGYVITKDNDKMFAVVNGNEMGPFDSVDSLIFNEDASRWCFTYYKDNKSYLYMSDTTQYGPYDSVSYPQFAKNSAMWATSVSKNNKYFVLMNGKETGPYEYADVPYYGPGGTWAYSGQANGKYTCFFSDGSKYGPFDYIYGPFFAANGSWAFTGSKGETTVIVINGKQYGPYESADLPVFSPDGGKWSFIGRKGENSVLYTSDGKNYGPFQYLYTPSYSQNGAAWGFWSSKKDKWTLTVSDGSSFGPFDNGGDGIAFSPDGASWWTFPGSEGNMMISLNRKKPVTIANAFRSFPKRAPQGDFLYWFTLEGNDIVLNRMSLK